MRTAPNPSPPNSQQLFQIGDNDDDGLSEGQSILSNLRALQSKIAAAWPEREVMLTQEEQKQLRNEIKSTCTFLIDLTDSSQGYSGTNQGFTRSA